MSLLKLVPISVMCFVLGVGGFWLDGGLNLKILNFCGWATAEFFAVMDWLDTSEEPEK